MKRSNPTNNFFKLEEKQQEREVNRTEKGEFKQDIQPKGVDTFFKPAMLQTIQKAFQPFLFRARKNKTTLYLLGTNHRLPFTVLPQCISEFVNKTQALVTKIGLYA